MRTTVTKPWAAMIKGHSRHCEHP